jgi:hypothetical protein
VQLPVLLGLAALWAAVLLPDVLRRLQSRRGGDSIASFHRHLSVLERSHHRAGSFAGSNVVRMTPRQTAPQPSPSLGSTRSIPPQSQRPVAGTSLTPVRRSFNQQRRQDIIVALLAASLLSFLATLAFSGALLPLHLAIDVLLGAYLLAVLAVTRRRPARSPVTYLPRATVSVPAQRRSIAR